MVHDKVFQSPSSTNEERVFAVDLQHYLAA